MLKKLKLLKKPLFQNRRWSCDFPPRKTPVAQKHCPISRQENMAFSTPVGLTWDSPPPPTESVRTDGRADVRTDGRTDGRADVRTYGRTDGRSLDYYVTTKISWIDRLTNFLSNGAPLAGFARRLGYNSNFFGWLVCNRRLNFLHPYWGLIESSVSFMAPRDSSSCYLLDNLILIDTCFILFAFC